MILITVGSIWLREWISSSTKKDPREVSKQKKLVPFFFPQYFNYFLHQLRNKGKHFPHRNATRISRSIIVPRNKRKVVIRFFFVFLFSHLVHFVCFSSCLLNHLLIENVTQSHHTHLQKDTLTHSGSFVSYLEDLLFLCVGERTYEWEHKNGEKKTKRKKNFWKTFFEFLHFKRKKKYLLFQKNLQGLIRGNKKHKNWFVFCCLKTGLLRNEAE